ncbi:MAG: YdcF family protein [Flavobacteriales bacterium]|nr:YdcF family protein [Flavobacteriales bacterium]
MLSEGVPIEALIIEEKSRYTIENLIEAKSVMDSLGFTSALLVSDPLGNYGEL